jgi:hypothetical protein
MNLSMDTGTTEVSSKHFSNVSKLTEDKNRLKLNKEVYRSRKDYKEAFNHFVKPRNSA